MPKFELANILRGEMYKYVRHEEDVFCDLAQPGSNHEKIVQSAGGNVGEIKQLASQNSNLVSAGIFGLEENLDSETLSIHPTGSSNLYISPYGPGAQEDQVVFQRLCEGGNVQVELEVQ